MSNPSKRKGSAFELSVVEYLQTHGFAYAERRVQAGSNDRGDVSGFPGVVVECKNEKRITLADYMDELEVEKRNASAPLGFVVVKRRNYGVERAYSIMEFKDQVNLLL